MSFLTWYLKLGEFERGNARNFLLSIRPQRECSLRKLAKDLKSARKEYFSDLDRKRIVNLLLGDKKKSFEFISDAKSCQHFKRTYKKRLSLANLRLN